MVLNYIESMTGEYGDSLLQEEPRGDLYWMMSSVRRYSFLFYPIENTADVLLIGDKFGALAGIISEKVRKVDTLVPTELHAEAVKHRYHTRDNLHIIVEQYDDWQLPQRYPYIFINLEYCDDYDITDTYEFDRLVNPAVKHLRMDGRLLLSARGDRLRTIQKLIYKSGFAYWQFCDPLGNGALFMEASRTGDLSGFLLPYPSPLNSDKWVRQHHMPLCGGEVFDQDLKLIEEVKKVQTDLLEKLVMVCKKHRLRVYPVYGTLLGIVRDGGMVPGDDDIDAALPREDYDKLLRLAGEFEGKYFLQTPFNDDCFYGGYTKLRNKETTAIHPQNEWTGACEGIGIDIFPIDAAYSDQGMEKGKWKRIRFLQRLLYAKSYGYFREFKDMKLLEWKSYKYLGKLFKRDKLIEKLYREMRKGDEEENRHAIYCHYGSDREDSARYLDMAAFRKTIPLLYEGVLLQVPSGWDGLLCGFYGKDYMKRQGFRERKLRHGFYDVDVPYTVYKKRFGGLKYPRSIREPIVLFGDGRIFKACLNYYKEKVNVIHLVQLPDEEAMQPVMGIPVERWEDFHALELPKASYRAVICSGDARFAEKILQAEGYDNYYIFWQDRNWMLYANQSQIWKDIQRLP